MFTETCVSYLKGLNRNRRVKQQAAGTRNNGAEVLLGAGSGIVLQLASGTAGNRWKFVKHHKRELTTHKQEKEQFIHLFIYLFLLFEVSGKADALSALRRSVGCCILLTGAGGSGTVGGQAEAPLTCVSSCAKCMHHKLLRL